MAIPVEGRKRFAMPMTSEDRRLDALLRLNLLDTPPSEAFDRVTRMASRLFGLPIAAVSLTDMDRQWFKSKVGIEHRSIPRDRAPCAAVAETIGELVIPDLAADPFYRDSTLGEGGIRFYAGVPLVTREGLGLGALCVLGTEPRVADEAEMASLRDLAEIVMAQIELQHAFGRIDPISGLPNRSQFFQDLEDLTQADRSPEPRIAVLVDLAQAGQLENLARVMGHSQIDTTVRETADLIRGKLGPGRTAYHVSATQFAFLAPPEAKMESYLAYVTATLARMRQVSHLRFVMTTVIGVVPFVPGETSTKDLLRALHSAAQDARASMQSVSVFSPALHDGHRRRFQLLQDFGAALASGDQLRLVYQPRVDLPTRRCVGAEVLLRWQHPTLGNISPAEFIPIVEHSPHARSMTAFVIDSALRQMAVWRGLGLATPLSINISAANLEEHDFAGEVGLRLMRHAIAADQIELEMTESAIMRDTDQALKHLNSLAAMGIRLAMDDFGTGYSSLAYLQRLPMHVVKIDQSFVRDIGEGAREQRLVHSMISLSKDLGFRVVAEGVETAEVAEMLTDMACDEAQGYFFARPLEADAFEAWLHQARAEPAIAAA